MNLTKASSFAAMLVLSFVLLGLGLTWLVIAPDGFGQRVLAFAAGCALAFAMVTAAGHLVGQLRTPRTDPTTEIVANEVVVTQPTGASPLTVLGRTSPARPGWPSNPVERRVS